MQAPKMSLRLLLSIELSTAPVMTFQVQTAVGTVTVINSACHDVPGAHSCWHSDSFYGVVLSAWGRMML